MELTSSHPYWFLLSEGRAKAERPWGDLRGGFHEQTEAGRGSHRTPSKSTATPRFGYSYTLFRFIRLRGVAKLSSLRLWDTTKFLLAEEFLELATWLFLLGVGNLDAP